MSTVDLVGETEETRNPRATRLPSLTGLRFYAALLVFLSHVALPMATIRLIADDKVEYTLLWLVRPGGGLGVTFFFVLSGFILTWSSRPKDTARAFWRRRAAKIIPSYLVAWVLAMVLVAGAATTLWQAIFTFTMLQAWVPDMSTYWAVNTPGWSLSVELFFYLCFPLLFFYAKRIPTQRLKYWVGGVVAGIALTPLITESLIPTGPMDPGQWGIAPNHLWFAYIFPPARLLDFALGILVARLVMTGRWRDIGMRWSGLLLALSYAVATFVPQLYSWRVVCVVPAVLLIASAAIADREGRSTFAGNRTTVWLGEISYAFYLVHYTVLQFGRSVLGQELFSTPVAVALIVAELLVAILASWALYAWVERPLTRRWSVSRTKTRA